MSHARSGFVVAGLLATILMVGCGPDCGGRELAENQAVESCMLCHNGSKVADYAGPGIQNPHPFPGADDLTCTACHGGNLEGQPGWRSPGSDGRMPAPPHDATGHTWHHSDTALIDYITLGGEQALAQMGVSFNSAMPGFGDVLSADEIADILDYIKSRWPEREHRYQAERSASDGE